MPKMKNISREVMGDIVTNRLGLSHFTTALIRHRPVSTVRAASSAVVTLLEAASHDYRGLFVWSLR